MGGNNMNAAQQNRNLTQFVKQAGCESTDNRFDLDRRRTRRQDNIDRRINLNGDKTKSIDEYDKKTMLSTTPSASRIPRKRRRRRQEDNVMIIQLRMIMGSFLLLCVILLVIQKIYLSRIPREGWGES